MATWGGEEEGLQLALGMGREGTAAAASASAAATPRNARECQTARRCLVPVSRFNLIIVNETLINDQTREVHWRTEEDGRLLVTRLDWPAGCVC